MGTLYESLLRGPDPAWSYVLDRLARHTLLTEARESVQSELARVVCLHHWWLSGDLFLLEGQLGWGPGHIDEYEGAGFPPPQRNAFGLLELFIRQLAQLPPDGAVSALVNRTGDTGSLAARAYRLLRSSDRPIESLIPYVYTRIAAKRTPYELGAARCFLCLSYADATRDADALAGLVLILAKRLDASAVRARSVALRRNFRHVPGTATRASACTARRAFVLSADC